MAMAMAVATKTTKPTQPTQHNTTHNPVLFYWQLISNLSSAPLSSLHFSLRFAALRFDSIRCLFHNSQFTEGEAEALPPGESPEFLGTQLDIKFLYLPGISVFSVFFFWQWKNRFDDKFFGDACFSPCRRGLRCGLCGKRRDTKLWLSIFPYPLYPFPFRCAGAKNKENKKPKTEKKREKLNPSPVELHARNVNFCQKRRWQGEGVGMRYRGWATGSWLGPQRPSARGRQKLRLELRFCRCLCFNYAKNAHWHVKIMHTSRRATETAH